MLMMKLANIWGTQQGNLSVSKLLNTARGLTRWLDAHPDFVLPFTLHKDPHVRAWGIQLAL